MVYGNADLQKSPNSADIKITSMDHYDKGAQLHNITINRVDKSKYVGCFNPPRSTLFQCLLLLLTFFFFNTMSLPTDVKHYGGNICTGLTKTMVASR